MANYEIVPTSAFTKGTAERKKSATSFSLPDFASSGKRDMASSGE
jgi:hypothetical protein